MPVSLKGAARSIEACRRAGVPVLAGGGGFGPAGRYAARVGAEAWAPDPVVAASMLEGWQDSGFPAPPPLAVPDDEEHLALEQEKDSVVSAALGSLDGNPVRVREALTFLVSALESALFVGDGAVFAASRPAAARLLAAGGSPDPSGSPVTDALMGAFEGRFPRAQGLVEESAELLHAQAASGPQPESPLQGGPRP